MKKIVIAGGTGFLGQVLENYFSKKGYQVKVLTRKPIKKNHVYWNAKTLGDWSSILEKTDALINLTGKSVDCRYTAKNKKLILDSRVESTHILGKAINNCKNPPKVWINSSTATIYRHSLDKKMTEATGEIGNDFSTNIAKSWEKAFNKNNNPITRKIILRTSIVLGKKGGAFIPLKNLAKIGFGGKQGSGNQKISWIHEIDFARDVEFLLNDEKLHGIFNLSVPQPSDNKTLMMILRKTMNIPFGISHPVCLLKIGAFLIRTETELILKSRNVIPERLLNNAFNFKFTDLKIALSDLIKD